MPYEVVVTDEFKDWYEPLSEDERPYRVLYAFDPSRAALLILGGDKTGDDRWYEKMVPRADVLYTEHLQAVKKKQQDAKRKKSNR